VTCILKAEKDKFKINKDTDKEMEGIKNEER
jgi:hypothetical protein